MIPLSIPNFEGNEEKYVLDAVSQGWVSTGGAYVDKLEDVIATYAGTSGSVACQSGTAALHMALIQAGVKENDMVLVPTLTFIAAVNPVKYVHGEPVFIDCDDSLCMDPAKLRKFCKEACEQRKEGLIHKESGRRVKAIIVVHVFGNLAQMEAIMDIGKTYDLKVIEDATEAIGSKYETGKYKGKMAGSIGDYGAYSFNGNKIITTGGGGMVLAKSKEELAHLKYLSTQCKDDEHFYIHNEIGYNYRMTNVQAAIGVAQMEELEEFIQRKNDNYERYKELLADCRQGYLLPFREETRSNKWFYSLVLNRDYCNKPVKDYILTLQNMGIQTRPIWGLIHEQRPYKDALTVEIEKAKYYSERIINLPSSTNITPEEIQTVCKAVKSL